MKFKWKTFLLLCVHLHLLTAHGDILRVELSELAMRLPWEPADTAFQSGALHMLGDRERIGPGQRWAETLIEITEHEKLPSDTVLRVVLQDISGNQEILAESVMAVDGTRALARVDMRVTELEYARLRAELNTPDGAIIGVAEIIMQAEQAAPLEPDTRIPVSIDLPENADAVTMYPVTFGVPFPAGTLWETENLRVTDTYGTEVPAQMEAVGYWAEDGTIKWVRVDALVAAPGTVFVELTPPTRQASVPQLSVTTTDDNSWLVNTGAAEYRLGSDGALIKQAGIDGYAIAREGNARGLYVIDQNGRLGRAASQDAQMTLESAGPVAASVRIEGDYRTDDGEALARHITRLEFFAGHAEARVTHTLVLTRDTDDIWFREYGWEFETQPGNQPRALLNISAENFAEVTEVDLATGSSIRMAQEDGQRLGMRPRAVKPKDTMWAPRTIGADRFTLRDQAGAILSKGERMGDWAALQGTSGAWLAICRAAAPQHPKDIELTANHMTLRLFSPVAGMEMDFRMESVMQRWGLWPLESLDFEMRDTDWQQERIKMVAKHTSNAIGWSKTHELVFAPLAASDPKNTGNQAAQLSRLIAGGVFANVSPDWIYKTRVLGPLHPVDRERFPEAEAVIAGTFWNHAERLPGFYTGFFDYFAGPHYYHPGRYRLTYTYLSDAWLVYARSGDRTVREITQSACRAFMDNYIAHWEGPNKTRGLFLSPAGGAAQLNTGKTEFPLYWETRSVFSLATTSNLQRSTLDYYLTGYRRAGDIAQQFARGMIQAWTPETRDWRAILTLRMLAQAYEFTWYPELRALVEETAFSPKARIYDPEGEILLSKDRPYRSTTYKAQTDMDVFVEVGDLLGSRPAWHIAEVLGRYNWERSGITSRSTGVNAHFLWERTTDPIMAAGFDRFRRISGLLLRDPETGATQGLTWSQMARIFQGLPRAMDVLARTDADKNSPVAWLDFSIETAPASLFVQKPENEALELLIRAPGTRGSGVTGQAVLLKPHARATREWAGQDLHSIREVSGGTIRVRIPKDAPGGVYELVLFRPGRHTVFADRRVPLSLYAPTEWQPAAMRPPLPVYFRVPTEGAQARIAFENGATLYTPEGEIFTDENTVNEWVELPADKAGTWHFKAVNPGKVRVENLPGCFTLGDPEFYLEAQPMTITGESNDGEDED